MDHRTRFNHPLTHSSGPGSNLGTCSLHDHFISITIGVWRIINQCFSTTDDSETDVPPYEIDIFKATQDLSLLGCVISNLILHILVAKNLYRLFDFHLNFEHSTGPEIFAVVVIIVWGLSTKIRDYSRTIKRAGIEREDPLGGGNACIA